MRTLSTSGESPDSIAWDESHDSIAWDESHDSIAWDESHDSIASADSIISSDEWQCPKILSNRATRPTRKVSLWATIPYVWWPRGIPTNSAIRIPKSSEVAYTDVNPNSKVLHGCIYYVIKCNHLPG